MTVIEASNSMTERLVEMVKPSHGGKDNGSHQEGALPVRDGIRFNRIIFNGCELYAYVRNGSGKVSPLVNHTGSEICVDRMWLSAGNFA